MFYSQKRRSSRNTKRKRYDVAYDFNISGGDSSDSDKKESDSNVDVEVDVVTVAPLAPSQTEAAKFFVVRPCPYLQLQLRLLLLLGLDFHAIMR